VPAPCAILLPPSEGKAPGGRAPAWTPASGRFGRELAGIRLELVEALSVTDGGDERLLGVGGRHLERARVANAALQGAPTLPAARRYTGVVYDALSLATLGPGGRRRALDSVLVFSGLLGAVALDDPVPDYRLKMGARLDPVGLVARRWQPLLSDLLETALRGRLVVDLLPAEHAAAWSPAPSLDVVRVALVDRAGGRVGGHDAKAAKGRLVRHLLTSRAAPERALRAFRDDRYLVRWGQAPTDQDAIRA
jgi:uncharacterized protein